MRENLRQARKAAGMTQQAMADMLGISIQYYQRLEKGPTVGNVALWDKMEDMLNVHQRVLREKHSGPPNNQD